MAVAGVFIAQVLMLINRRPPRIDGSQRFLFLGVAGGLVAFLPHGLVDWNLHIPGNSLLCAIILGLFVGCLLPLQKDQGEQRNAQLGGKVIPRVIQYAAVITSGVIIGTSLLNACAETKMKPMRRALLWNMWSKAEISQAEKASMLKEALPDAFWAASIRPNNAEYAELIGRAYLHLSKGSNKDDLEKAKEWFSKALALSPASIDLIGTLMEIRLVSTTNSSTTQ